MDSMISMCGLLKVSQGTPVSPQEPQQKNKDHTVKTKQVARLQFQLKSGRLGVLADDLLPVVSKYCDLKDLKALLIALNIRLASKTAILLFTARDDIWGHVFACADGKVEKLPVSQRQLFEKVARSLKGLSFDNVRFKSKLSVLSLCTQLKSLSLKECELRDGDLYQETAEKRESLLPPSLTLLDLSGNDRLAQKGFECISLCTQLAALCLNDCRVEDVSVFRNLTQLRYLYLSNCLYEGALAEIAHHFPSLEHLDLSLNRGLISRADCEAIATLQKLRNLNVAYSALQDQDIETLASIPTLKGLNISYCRVSDDLLRDCPQMPSLTILSIGLRNLSSEGFEQLLLRQKDLHTLTLTEFRIHRRELQAISWLEKLKSLVLRNFAETDLSQMQNIYMNLESFEMAQPHPTRVVNALSICNLLESNPKVLRFDGISFSEKDLMRILSMCAHSLEHLKIANSEIPEDVFEKVFSRISFPNLQRLNLRKNSIGDSTLVCLSMLPKLEVLNVSHTHVSLKGLLQLQSCPSLQRVEANDTHIPPTEAKKFRRSTGVFVITNHKTYIPMIFRALQEHGL
jgi:Leucine-rich repeat (LRR) protein